MAGHRSRCTAALLASALALTAATACARRQAATRGTSVPASPNARVLVSTREVRLIFPPDTAAAWGWSDRSDSSYHARYAWQVLIDGMEGPRTLAFSVGRADGGPAERMSLDSLLARGGSLLCWSNGSSFGCSRGHTVASPLHGRVVLSMTDTATIRRLFALRPRTVHAWHSVPEEPDRRTGDSIVVEYVAPQIPMPDARVLAEAGRLRREATTPTKWTYRMIGGGPRAFGPLWLVAGDSADLGIAEVRCLSDTCHGTELDSTSTWAVDDTTIVALRTTLADSLRVLRAPKVPDLENVSLVRSSATAGVVAARRPGRTVLRVTLPVPAYEGPPSPHWSTAPNLEREIIVSPPAGRVELSAPRGTVRASEPAGFRALAFDRAGAIIAGAPVEVRRVQPPSRTIADEAGRAALTFDSAGTYTLIARFGGRADTLTVTVVGRRMP